MPLQLPLKNANRTMNLLTQTEAKKLPPLGSQDGKGQQALARVKFFLGGWTWYASEMNPDTGMCFGKVVSPDEPEGDLGYFSVHELAELMAPLVRGGRPVVAVERDRHWKPTPLQDCR